MIGEAAPLLQEPLRGLQVPQRTSATLRIASPMGCKFYKTHAMSNLTGSKTCQFGKSRENYALRSGLAAYGSHQKMQPVCLDPSFDEA